MWHSCSPAAHPEPQAQHEPDLWVPRARETTRGNPGCFLHSLLDHGMVAVVYVAEKYNQRWGRCGGLGASEYGAGYVAGKSIVSNLRG